MSDYDLLLAPNRVLLTKIVTQRVDRLLGEAVTKFRSGTIDPQEAYSVLAQITAMRNLLADLADPKSTL